MRLTADAREVRVGIGISDTLHGGQHCVIGDVSITYAEAVVQVVVVTGGTDGGVSGVGWVVVLPANVHEAGAW